MPTHQDQIAYVLVYFSYSSHAVEICSCFLPVSGKSSRPGSKSYSVRSQLDQHGAWRGGVGEVSHIKTYVTRSRRTRACSEKDATLGQDGGAVAGGTGGSPYITQIFLLMHFYFLISGPTVNDDVIEDEEEDRAGDRAHPQDPRSRGPPTLT